MTKEQLINTRSSVCELCGSDKNLDIFKVEPKDEHVILCETCKEELEKDKITDTNHFRCLSESIWSEVPAVQALSYRILNKLSSEIWAQDILDVAYLDDEIKEWATALEDEEDEKDEKIIVKDSNGNFLSPGDSVTIVKDLEVKGAGFTAKRGTIVKNIAFNGNPDQIEGRVNGVKIVLLTKFLKKV